MSNADPLASTATTPQLTSQDAQMLISMLGNLMPVLLRIQSQISQPMGQPWPSAPIGLMTPTPMLDQQAAANLMENITADCLRTLSSYLETHTAQHPDLESCVAIVTQAAHCFTARDYAQSFGLIWQAYRSITALRTTNPQLPPLRSTGLAAFSFPSATTLTH